MSEHLFDLDGHLTDLTIDRFLYEPIEDDLRTAVDSHVDTCGECKARLEEVRGFDAGFTLAPPAPVAAPAKVISLASARKKRDVPASAWLTLLAAAAAFVMVVIPQNQSTTTPGFDPPVPIEPTRIKGAGFDMEVWLDDGQGGRRLDDGATVHPGDHVGFRVKAKDPGFVMIVGIDSKRSLYGCYPQREARAAALTPSPTPVSVGAAIGFDDVLGDERLVGIHCETAFTFDDAKTIMRRPPEGCSLKEVRLSKTRSQP